MPRKNCKYCKSDKHNIDDCPQVICRNCKQRGHVDWKCEWITQKKKKPIIKKDEKKNKKTDGFLYKRQKAYINNLFIILDNGKKPPVFSCKEEWDDVNDTSQSWINKEINKFYTDTDRIAKKIKKNINK